jgi:hypothetical protein
MRKLGRVESICLILCLGRRRVRRGERETHIPMHSAAEEQVLVRNSGMKEVEKGGRRCRGIVFLGGLFFRSLC